MELFLLRRWKSLEPTESDKAVAGVREELARLTIVGHGGNDNDVS